MFCNAPREFCKDSKGFCKDSKVFCKHTEVFCKDSKVFCKHPNVFCKDSKVFCKHSKVFCFSPDRKRSIALTRTDSRKMQLQVRKGGSAGSAAPLPLVSQIHVNLPLLSSIELIPNSKNGQPISGKDSWDLPTTFPKYINLFSYFKPDHNTTNFLTHASVTIVIF